MPATATAAVPAASAALPAAVAVTAAAVATAAVAAAADVPSAPLATASVAQLFTATDRAAPWQRMNLILLLLLLQHLLLMTRYLLCCVLCCGVYRACIPGFGPCEAVSQLEALVKTFISGVGVGVASPLLLGTFLSLREGSNNQHSGFVG